MSCLVRLFGLSNTRIRQKNLRLNLDLCYLNWFFNYREKFLGHFKCAGTTHQDCDFNNLGRFECAGITHQDCDFNNLGHFGCAGITHQDCDFNKLLPDFREI